MQQIAVCPLASVRGDCGAGKNAAQIQQARRTQSLVPYLCKLTNLPACLTQIKLSTVASDKIVNRGLKAWVMLLLKHLSYAQLPSSRLIECLLLLSWENGLL